MAEDPTLQTLLHHVQQGWPMESGHLWSPEFCTYWHRHQDLTVREASSPAKKLYDRPHSSTLSLLYAPSPCPAPPHSSRPRLCPLDPVLALVFFTRNPSRWMLACISVLLEHVMAAVFLDDGSVYRKHITQLHPRCGTQPAPTPPQLQLDPGGFVPPPTAGPQPQPPAPPPLPTPTPHPSLSPLSPRSPWAVAPVVVPTPTDVDASPRPGFSSPADPGSDVDMRRPPTQVEDSHGYCQLHHNLVPLGEPTMLVT
ncbi:uncharacterized protein LOC126474853 [Schistocerca serialis cubense]|uniref:uncharacterized protein LOC126474853 n=1 Tax=Schistocerca serialis cubense TaxID=2023355 RepID=UPI00214F0A6D|nr:uncharacterized protein LOC126474853 [Schistocerca serialis cubense]